MTFFNCVLISRIAVLQTVAIGYRYPKVVDRAIEDMLSASTVTQPQDNAMDVDESHTSTIVTENRAKMIHEFIALSLPQSRHQVLMEASSTVALCVYHHNPSMRAAAVREIGKSLKQLDKVRL